MSSRISSLCCRTAYVSAALLLLSSGTAKANGSERVLAESLYQDGKRLLEAGDLPAACMKLAESQRLDPGGGTILMLGVCHEREGKFATAWADFHLALAMARRAERADRIQIAEQHLATLQARLPFVTLVVAPERAVQGLVVMIDDVPVEKPAWNTALPIDPGSHRVAVTASHRQRWETKLEVQEADKLSVEVPELKHDLVVQLPMAQPNPNQAVASSNPETKEGTPIPTRRKWGFIIGGAGIAGMAVGSYFGIRAFQKESEKRKSCGSSDKNCQAESDARDDERDDAAALANVGFGLGVIGLLAGGYLVWTARSPASKKPQATLDVVPELHPKAAALHISGSF